MSTKGIDVVGSEKLTLYEYGTHIEIVRAWFDGVAFIISAFALFWDVAVVYVFLSQPDDFGLYAYLFLILFALLGVYLTYMSIARWVNSTHISVYPSKIDIHHRPLPWPGNETIDIAGLKHFYTRIGNEETTDYSRVYIVQAVTQNNVSISLLECSSSKQAHRVEQALAQYFQVPATSPSLKRPIGIYPK